MLDRDTQAFYAIAPLYAISSIYYGNWFSAISYIEDKRGISDSTLGDYLSLATIGAVACMITAPRVLDTIGSNFSITIGYIIIGIGMILLAVNSTDILFIFGMITYGYGTILVYSSMVAQGAVLEKSASQLWMGLFTASSCIGGVSGGLIGGIWLQYTSLAIWEEMLIVSVVLCTSMILGSLPWLYTKEEESAVWRKNHDSDRMITTDHFSDEGILAPPQDALSSNPCVALGCTKMCNLLCCLAENNQDGRREAIDDRLQRQERVPILKVSMQSALEEKGGGLNQVESAYGTHQQTTHSTHAMENYPPDWLGLVALCCITSLSYFVEGSIGDWGSIYIQHHWTETGYVIGILPYLLEKICMFIASIYCDYICTHLLSRYLVFQASIVLTMVGFTMSIVGYILPATTTALVFTICGFGVAGFGLGLTVPIWYSISGRGIRGFRVSQSVSWTMTAAMCGYLVEPLMVGNVSTASGSLSYSFLMEVGLLGLTMIMGFLLPRHYFESYSKKI